MLSILKFAHLAAAILWVGGMAVILFALRPAATVTLEPPLRLALLARTLARFFVIVWACVAILLVTGLAFLLAVGMKAAPLGWHLMLGIGLLMFLIYAHIYFAPFRRLQRAVAAANWPAGGQAALQLARLVSVNFLLGWLAIASVRLLP